MDARTGRGFGRGSNRRDQQFVKKSQNQGKEQPTRKQIESEQKALLEKKAKEMEEQIEELESSKQKNPAQGVNNTFTLVKNRTTAQLEKIPDLSPHWVEKPGHFLPFLPQNNEISDANILTESDEVIEILNVDISHLLRKKYNQFWSTVLYDPSLMQFVDSYLRYRSRPYEFNRKSSPEHDELFKRVFRIVIRLSQHKESPSEFMDKDYFPKMIYDNNIFDIPKIMDICVLFGNLNPDLLKNMVASLFQMQPLFIEDLKKIAPAILNTVQDRMIALEKEKFIDKNREATIYLLDIFATLSSFLVIYPDGSYFFDTDKISLIKIASQLYNNTLPNLQQSNAANEEFSYQIMETKRFILSVVNTVMQTCYFYVIITPFHLASTKARSSKRDQVADKLVRMIQEIAESQKKIKPQDSSFLKDFARKYALKVRLEQVKGVASEIKFNSKQVENLISNLEGLCGPLVTTSTEKSKSSKEEAEDPNRRKFINQVKDLFPDLGEGFIEACLDSYRNNTEQVINAILENNLPPHLSGLDRKMPKQQKEQAIPKKKKSLVEKRRNVFSNDEFDITTQDKLDASKVYLKKAQQDSKLSAFFEERADLQSFKSRIADYEYEDEYDDSYDQYQPPIASDKTIDEEVTLIESETEEDEEGAEETSEEISKQDDQHTQQKHLPGFGRGRGSQTQFTQPPGAAKGRGGKDGRRGRGGTKGDYFRKVKSHDRKEQSSKKRGSLVP